MTIGSEMRNSELCFVCNIMLSDMKWIQKLTIDETAEQPQVMTMS